MMESTVSRYRDLWTSCSHMPSCHDFLNVGYFLIKVSVKTSSSENCKLLYVYYGVMMLMISDFNVFFSCLNIFSL